MFYLKVKDLNERTKILAYLKECGISAAFHYVPLHSSPFGEKISKFAGRDIYTTSESEKLIRLPLWYGIGDEDIYKVCESIKNFFKMISNEF